MKPWTCYLKLNVTVGFDHDLLEGIVGATIRDHNDKFIVAANEKLNFCFDSFSAEAIAVGFGLNLARTVGCSKIELVSDSAEVVSALQEGTSSSVAGAIFDDCFYMSLDFDHVIYDHCNGDSNQVAHELAKLVRYSPPGVSMESPPEVVVSFIVNDGTMIMIE